MNLEQKIYLLHREWHMSINKMPYTQYVTLYDNSKDFDDSIKYMAGEYAKLGTFGVTKNTPGLTNEILEMISFIENNLGKL